ncbi:hypothetical protein ACFVJK_30355 [Streptomyces sp. NPDC127172]|uniref:hypothetical protein n=1 Tax=Streptomyces sp. NPDC127172 TaxID=3345382 RepID=UPI003642D0AE
MRLNVTVTPDEYKPDREWALEQGLDTIGVVWRYDWPAGSRFENTPFELWTPSRKKDQPVPRFATLEEAVIAADEIAEERARTTTVKAHEVHRETYRGADLAVTYHPATVSEYSRGLSRHSARYDGKDIDCPNGDIETAVAKLRQKIDVIRENEELAPKLVPLTDTRRNVVGMPGWDDGAAPKVGDVAYVYGHGMYRRGLVVSVAKTRATVAYVTATSPGVVHRKADRFTELVAG